MPYLQLIRRSIMIDRAFWMAAAERWRWEEEKILPDLDSEKIAEAADDELYEFDALSDDELYGILDEFNRVK